MELRTLTALALAMGLAAPALAQEYTFDADSNGEVTEEEQTTYDGESFAEADADQSGFWVDGDTLYCGTGAPGIFEGWADGPSGLFA